MIPLLLILLTDGGKCSPFGDTSWVCIRTDSSGADSIERCSICEANSGARAWREWVELCCCCRRLYGRRNEAWDPLGKLCLYCQQFPKSSLKVLSSKVMVEMIRREN